MGRFARKVRRARHASSRAAVEVLLFLGLFILLCTLLLWTAENAPPHEHDAHTLDRQAPSDAAAMHGSHDDTGTRTPLRRPRSPSAWRGPA